MIAITDHDTAEGWAEAAETAAEVGHHPGPRHGDQHPPPRPRRAPAGLPARPDYPPLAAELARILAGRDSRVPAMVERLRELGIDDHRSTTYAAPPGDAAATGRPHVADALVTLGRRRGPGRGVRAASSPPDARRTPTGTPPRSAEMVDIVAAAGGVSVVAHPWGRHERSSLDEAALAELAGARAGRDRGRPPGPRRRSREALRAIARNLGLVATGSSDHHGAGKSDHELGCNTTDPDAVRAAARPGRRGRGALRAGVRPRWSTDERRPQHRAAGRGLRDPVRDHGPGRHGPDLPVPDQRPVAGDARDGPPGRRSRCRSS